VTVRTIPHHSAPLLTILITALLAAAIVAGIILKR
jgi:hypothetical protein